MKMKKQHRQPRPQQLLQQQARASFSPRRHLVIAYVHPGTTVDREPLPKEGDVVEAGQVIGLVEAMKMFNEVVAPQKAKLTKIKVQNETLVKIGDALFELEPL